MCFNFRENFGEENGMFVVYAKIKKKWCCLEHIDLLFKTLRFVFFAETITCVFSHRFLACY
jgi:hypothetical protein